MNRVYKELDLGTYGGSLAAKHLVEELNLLKDVKITRRVGGLYYNYTTLMKNIKLLPQHSFNYFSQKLHNEIFKQVLESETFPKKVKSFLANIIVAYYRQVKKDNKEFNEAAKTFYKAKETFSKGISKNKIFNGENKYIQLDSTAGNKLIPFTDTKYFEPVLKNLE